jgi:hypothetical protein
MRLALILTAAIAAAPVMLSRAETIARVKQELARRLKVPPEQIELMAESEETWPNANLGCVARKPLDEPMPTKGYSLTLSHQGVTYVYHTDRSGHFRRCNPGKPLGPINR